MQNQHTFPVIDLARTGRSIERHRREAGLSVRELQNYFGFEYPQAIYKWQHGECLPTVDNLLALSRVLQVSMEDLLVYDDQEVIFFCGVERTFFLMPGRLERLPVIGIYPSQIFTISGGRRNNISGYKGWKIKCSNKAMQKAFRKRYLRSGQAAENRIENQTIGLMQKVLACAIIQSSTGTTQFQ